MVLIHVKDEPRSADDSLLHSIHPSLECLVMVFHNEINWASGPGEQAVEFFDRIIKEAKVVQVDVQDRRHGILVGEENTPS